MTWRAAALSACATLALCGCAGLSAADRAPRTDPIARLRTTSPSPWTSDLGDPALKDLLARADLGALDVKLALARLERAEGEREAAEAVGRVRVTMGAAAALGGRTFRSARSAATPTLEGSYDIDVWRQFAHGRRAARADRAATQWEVTAARLEVGADVVRAYAALQAARDAEAGARRRQAIAMSVSTLTRRRQSEGVVTARAVDASAQAQAVANAAVEQAREDVRLQAARLADLTGQQDHAPPPPAPIPQPQPQPQPFASSAEVDGRPDVQAALARLSAADQRRSAAVQATRPQFQIAAAIGAPDAAIATLLDVRALAWAVAGTVAHEVLDGGARRARVHIASAEADLADLDYRKRVLDGWSEIRAALAGEASAARQVVLAETDLAATRAQLRTGELRHAAGAADGLAVAALADRVEVAADGLRQARLTAVDARVRRTLATGGR